MHHRRLIWITAAVFACAGGDDVGDPGETDTDTPESTWECTIPAGEEPDFAIQLGCPDDFAVLASAPLDASIPGAQSVKTVVDRLDEDTLYFQNSQRYAIHWEFAFNNLSGDGLPFVPDLSSFNVTEYYSPDRRFILGAVTYYEEPDVWAYEVAPYDTADVDMITTAYQEIVANSWFGEDLYFHPSSTTVETVAEGLADDVKVITTEELFAGITYQFLNLGTTMGLLQFYTAEQVDGVYINYRELVVLDAIPNDISIVAGVITSEFQTPLSHINVLSQNRGTPNMALDGAYDNEELRALDGKWVELTVDAFDYAIREVTQDEADVWWEANKPEPLDAAPMDVSVTELVDDVDLLDLDNYDLGGALDVAIPAFGGKGSHYGGLALIGDDVPCPKAFMIPMYYYDQHMTENGLWDIAIDMMADPDFQGNPEIRGEMLEELQEMVEDAPLDPDFYDMVMAKLDTDFSGIRMRFRSSTNAEDLGDFTGAGLYTSKTGDPNDPDKLVEDAIRGVWASVWFQRAYEERDFYSIDHTKVGMALLVHRSFPDEEANGVAITNNIYDSTGLEPAFYVNVQFGESSVVKPEPGVVTDQFMYYYDLPGQPIVFVAHSNLIPAGDTVLTTAETYELGTALSAIHDYFYPVYGAGGGWYAMDTEFKFDGEPGEDPELFMKQARPYPGIGL